MAYGAFASAMVFAVAMLRADNVAPPIPVASAVPTPPTAIGADSTISTSAALTPPASPPEDPPVPPPFFTGETMPEPPQQTAPWIPPAPSATLSEKLIATTRELFAQGLADPRGCEYREVEVVTGNQFGASDLTPVHAWVLPATPGTAQRFAIGLNGLVYPVVKVGPPVDLRSEVLSTISGDRAQMEIARVQYEKAYQGQPSFHFGRAVLIAPEKAHLTLKIDLQVESLQMLPLPFCLLLRLGENELAAQWWQEWTAYLAPDRANNKSILADPYGMLASELSWAMLDRAVGAHVRGDDRLALITARELTRIRPGLEAAAIAHGWGPNPGNPLGTSDGVAPLFYFLAPLPSLLADQERRAIEPKVERMIQPEVTGAFWFDHVNNSTSMIARLRIRVPDAAKRIAGLIRDLEVVSAPPGNIGGVVVGSAAIMQALVAEGEAAVEPLLDCLENDERLTRSDQLTDTINLCVCPPAFISVREAARAALDQILGSRAFSLPPVAGNGQQPTPEEIRQQLAPAYRATWEKYKNLSQDRMFAILADDHSSFAQLLDAAAGVTNPVSGPDNFLWGPPWTGYPLAGEALRSRTNPSLTELLTTRMQALVTPSDLYGAGALAMALARWDGAARRDELRQMSLLMVRAGTTTMTFSEIYGEMIPLYLARAAIGDPRAAEDYAAWIVTIKPADFDMNRNPECILFSPLWLLPDQPAITRAATQLFGPPDSPWQEIFQAGSHPGSAFIDSRLIGSPLITLAVFRQLVLQKLADKTAIGTATLREGGNSVILQADHGGQGGDQTNASADPLAPPAGTGVHFRTCDLVAHQLGTIEGCPPCELYWPEAKRDEAVSACGAFLQKNGAQLKAGGPYSLTVHL